MRFGSKVLFDDVTTTFSAGRRYGLTGPNGAGKSTFMKLLTGELPPQRGTVVRPAKLGVLRQDQFAFDEFRVIDTVDHGQPAAVERARRSASALRQGRHDRRGRHAPRRARGHRRRGGRLRGRERRGDPAAGARHPRRAARAARWRSCRAARRCACCSRRRSSASPQALLLDEPTNHLDLDSIHWLREFLAPLRGHAHRHLARPPLPERASARTSPTSTTRRSSPTPAATTTWCSPRRRSARASRRRTSSARRRSRSCRTSSRASRAGTRASQVMSRKKEVERLQTTELARSNIQRPYIKFAMNRPSGRVAARDRGRQQGVRRR